MGGWTDVWTDRGWMDGQTDGRMGWDGMGWDMELDGMGWHGMAWDMGWDGMGWDGMGWDWIDSNCSQLQCHKWRPVLREFVAPGRSGPQGLGLRCVCPAPHHRTAARSCFSVYVLTLPQLWHCTAQHCTPIHSTVPHYAALNCTALHPALHRISSLGADVYTAHHEHKHVHAQV